MLVSAPSAIRLRRQCLPYLGLSLLAMMLAACNGGQRPARNDRTDLKPYWPTPQPRFQQAELASLQVPVPQILDAEFVNDDTLCMTCHETYAKTFQHNVHREQSCEKCHGPASRHLVTRGQEPGTILSFKKLSPPERSELCLKCHEQNACTPGANWRTSPHAHNGVSCNDCHTSHYNVPPGTPPTQLAHNDTQSREQFVAFLQEQLPVDMVALREESKNLGALTPHVCYRCHANMAQQEHFGHPHQIGGSAGFDCTTCHNPHGKVRPETRSELCLQCHTNAPTMAWHSSIHSLAGVGCVDCHNPHPNPTVQPFVNIDHTNIRRPKRLPMSVDEPGVCYKCHADIYAKTSMPSHHPIKEGVAGKLALSQFGKLAGEKSVGQWQ